MPKFSVQVEVKATSTYTIEIEADNEAAAEREATSRYQLEANLPEDFQVNKGYCAYDIETEQLTAICPSCDQEHALPTHGTRLCHCAAIATRPGEFWPNGEPFTVAHLIVDGVCTPAPWGDNDQDYCRACDLKVEQEFDLAFRRDGPADTPRL